MQYKRIRAVLAAIPLLTVTGCGSGRARAPIPQVRSPIDTLALRGHTQFLASNRLAGRATASAGADLAAEYLESACIRLGLKPLGNKYLHQVDLVQASIDTSATEFRVSGPGGSAVFRAPADFLPNAGWTGTATVRGTVVIGETSNDLLAAGGPALSGSVAVVGGSMGPAADDSLQARGVVGLVQLEPDPRGYLLFIRSRGATRLLHADTGIVRSFSPALPSVIAGPELSRRLREAAGSARTASLADSITMTVTMSQRPARSSNVYCMLEGSDPRARDTAFAYTAHYDHLGIGPPDSRGDTIYNGFSDNAAGVAMLLGIADVLARPNRRPKHSVLFLFFTGEEQGLLGSDFYVARPPWPLTRTLAVINLDAGAPPGRPWSWRIAGGNGHPLGRVARDVAAEHGWSATTSPATPNSDYYPFARSGVPAIFIVPGSGPYQGLSVDSSQALRRRWDRYHEPADEWAPDFPFEGLARYAEYALYIGLAVDEGKRDRRAGPPIM